MSEYLRVREAAGMSRDRAAVLAGVSYPTARLFEMAGPSAVKDPKKRAALVRFYEAMQQSAVEHESLTTTKDCDAAPDELTIECLLKRQAP